LGKGYDHDVVAANALLLRAKARDGRIVMPDGMSYRVLVLPDQPAIALPVLQKAQELARAGARVAGPAYKHAEGLRGDDAAVRRIAAAMGFKVKTGLMTLSEAGVVPDLDADAPPRGGGGELLAQPDHRGRGEGRALYQDQRAKAYEGDGFDALGLLGLVRSVERTDPRP